MNEVTKINLGRQVFTIAADAQSDLTIYLDAIKKEVSDKEVVEEVEIRMAELLVEQGLNADKVVLKKDVEFLKKQLGNPKDFKEDGEETEEQDKATTTVSKRLFRDTSNAMIAGVASGLATYMGLDVLLVRLVFVLILFVTFGWGILIYILLWLLVPEAKTASDRLQMAGQPVTVSGIKKAAKDADVKGAAKRLNSSLADPINRLFHIWLKIVGICMVAFGLSIFFGLIAGFVYFLNKSNIWGQYNIFPIGASEHILLYLAMLVIALGAIFVILFGVAIFRRKWPIHGWVTGTLAGILLLGLTVCGALGGSVYPSVRDAYNANLHKSTRILKPFTNINTTNDNIWNINFAYASNYYVTMNYFGSPNLSNIKTSVSNKTLIINTNNFDWHRSCPVLCIPNSYNMSMTVYSPNFNQLQNEESSGNQTSMPSSFYGPKGMKLWRN
jgi:phage shock protein PspC (stress-responsive transcriptional regulator)/sulfur carrier protein ThiS